MDFKITYKAVGAKSALFVFEDAKKAEAGKPPQIKSVTLFLRRFQEYHSPKFGRIIPTASYSENLTDIPEVSPSGGRESRGYDCRIPSWGLFL